MVCGAVSVPAAALATPRPLRVRCACVHAYAFRERMRVNVTMKFIIQIIKFRERPTNSIECMDRALKLYSGQIARN